MASGQPSSDAHADAAWVGGLGGGWWVVGGGAGGHAISFVSRMARRGFHAPPHTTTCRRRGGGGGAAPLAALGWKCQQHVDDGLALFDWGFRLGGCSRKPEGSLAIPIVSVAAPFI